MHHLFESRVRSLRSVAQPRRPTNRWMWLIPLLILPLGLTACAALSSGSSTNRVTLHVENQGYFDVNVLVLQSPLARGIRLGTVNGGSSRTFRVRVNDLQAGGVMIVQARAIAGRSTWTSPGLVVNAGSVARLEVRSTGAGDLNQSQFYLQ